MRVKSNHTIRLSAVLLSAGCALGLGLQSANAATKFVGTCHAGSSATIQGGVNAAAPGDTVAVCAGTYAEEVTIQKNITLLAYQGGYVHVVAPSGGFVENVAEIGCSSNCAVAQIAVLAPATSVTVKGLTVDGNGNNATGCGVDYVGIYYQNVGGTISGNTVENQIYPLDLQGCQGGQGIFAELENTGTTVAIGSNTATNFDKNGITVNGNYYGPGGGSAKIAKNIVTGVTGINTAQNGIQIAFGATGTANSNTINNIFYPYYYENGYTASGILLYDIPYGAVAEPQVKNNTLAGAQTSIALDAVNGTSSALVPVTGNKITGAMYGVQAFSDGVDFATPVSDDYVNISSNTIGLANPSGGGRYDGIDACADHIKIAKNTVNGDTTTPGSQSGVHLDSTCIEPDYSSSGVQNTVVSNPMINYVCAGILSGPAAGLSTIGGNTFGSQVGVPNIVYGSNTCSGSDARQGGKALHAAPFRPQLAQN